jgi:Raf kinase inhibitor-like YbhB/YbcL family protein
MRKSLILAVSLLAVLVLLVGVGMVACGGDGDADGAPNDNGTDGVQPDDGEMELTSAAFQDGGTLPDDYTCDGQNISPPLEWDFGPAGTSSFVLIVDDPDSPSGAFTHWIFFDIPSHIVGLEAAVPDTAEFDNDARQGDNDFGDIGYAGPCPPPGEPHHYRFTIYALNTTLGLEAGATRAQLLDAMQGHVLAQSEITAIYER